jgi:hypothetical protein
MNSTLALTQGGQANTTGRTLEAVVTQTLEGKGLTVVPYRDYCKQPAIYGRELLLKNVPYTSIYGHAAKGEFVLHSDRYGLNIRIECKWQQRAGSVDEKFPYVYLNCIERIPEPEVFIIVDGGGAKEGSLQWLRDTVAAKRYMQAGNTKRVTVMTLAEFIAWAHRTLR